MGWGVEECEKRARYKIGVGKREERYRTNGDKSSMVGTRKHEPLYGSAKRGLRQYRQ